MNEKNMMWIEGAIKLVSSGITNRIDNPDKTIKVYSCGTVIRIDISKGVCKK